MILAFFNVLLITAILFWSQPEGKLKIYYWTGVPIKIIAGIILGLIYWSIGEGDTIVFHQKASLLHQLSFAEYISEFFTAKYPVFKSEGRTELFTKILSLFYWVTGGNYWISGTYLSVLCFAGSWQVVKTLNHHFPKLILPAVISFLFLPTAMFWTSGVLKDSLIAASAFYLFSIAIKYYKDEKFKILEYILTGFSLLLLFYLRFYLLAVIGLSLGILAWWIMIEKLEISVSSKWIGTALFVIVLALLSTQLNMNLHLDKLPQAIFDNYQTIYQNSNPQNAIEFPTRTSSWGAVLKSLPIGLMTGISRPFIWEANEFTMLFALEHLLITALLLFTIVKMELPKNKLVIIGLIYTIILSTFLPLVAPNFGTLMRYEAIYTPVLLFILLIPVFNRTFSNRG